METNERHIVAIDLGTSKMALTVAKVNGNDRQIIYYKEVHSAGIKYSGVYNILHACAPLSYLIKDAEDSLGIKINQAVIGMPKFPIRQEANSGKIVDRGEFTEISQEDIDKCIDAILEMKIEKYVDKFVTELSGGQMQRVTIARSIAQDANFFIFDEPTSSFDLKNQLNLMKIMKRIIEKKNACLIVALHDINLAMRYSDKVIVLKDGKVYNSGPAKDVITEKMIFDVYGVKSQIIEDKNGIHVHTLDDDDCEFIDLE